jgi:hypothetical protein
MDGNGNQFQPREGAEAAEALPPLLAQNISEAFLSTPAERGVRATPTRIRHSESAEARSDETQWDRRSPTTKALRPAYALVRGAFC